MIKWVKSATGIGLIFVLWANVQAADSGTIINDDILKELKNMIQQQQVQLDRQAAEIKALKDQIKGGTVTSTTKAGAAEDPQPDKMVSSKLSKVKVTLNGQFNRAILFGDNGDSSNWYFVDNSNSQTRLGLNASVDLSNNWIAAGRIEYGIVSNGSSDVNQLETHDATDTNFKLRWAELSFANDNFGKFSLGKGDSASNNSAEVDLSGTTVASYSGVSDMAASMSWYNGTPITEDGLTIGDTYSNLDGLSRTDRIRYDTPSFAGFSLASSISSGDAFDGALLFSRNFAGTKIAAAFAAAKPEDLSEATDAQYSGSASVLFPMGFSATLAAGHRDLEDSTRENPTNWWAKLGYQTKFYESATTAFSFDYGETSDLAADGDTGKTWAFAAVHNLIDWGTEIYMTYRGYELESNMESFDDIHVFWTGARVKF